MSLIFKSRRVGKGGRVFTLYKFRTLKTTVNTFPTYRTEDYLFMGKFLRKTHCDELPQIWNWIKRDLNLVGVRPEEEKTYALLPEQTKELLASVRPGLTSLASIHFFDEGHILEHSGEVEKDYWTRIKPMKIVLDVFYVQNKSVLLDLAILWITFKKILWSLTRP